MKYTFHFAWLTARTLFSSWVYYVTLAVITALFFVIVPRLAPLLNDRAITELLAGQLVYVLLSTGVLMVFMCLHPVFVAEKKEGSLLPLLYSPASAGELLAGKCLGIMAAALFGSATALLIPLAGYPIIMKAFLSLTVLVALFIVFGILFAYAVIAGVLLLCLRNSKVLYPVFFFLNYVPMQIQKYSKAYLESHGLASANWLHLGPMFFLLSLAAAIYEFYFSRQRIVGSM